MAEDQNNKPDSNLDDDQGGDGKDYKALYEQLKADSRKWEERAKANKAKADKFDQLAGDGDDIEQRIAALESENQAMKDAEARHALVAKVAASVGLSESLVETLNGTDEDALTKQAKAIADLKPKGAPNAPEAGKFPRGSEPKGADADKRKFVRQLLGND